MKRIPLLTIAAAMLLIPAARAQEPTDQPDRAERRQRVIAAFDADGDGELNDEERAKARKELGGASERPERSRRERDREGRGPRPDGPPEMGRLFERFDENGDDQLSRDEFTRLMGAMREMRERRDGPSRGGRGRAERDDRPGPPPGPPEDGDDRPRRRRGEIGDAEDFRPLQNPGPPLRRDDERGARGPREQGPNQGRRPERMSPPNPERLFNAFDANNDDQLSREEFRELTATLRERMADFRGRGGPREGARGPNRRLGPPDGSPRPPRPPRPDFESADPPEPASDANSA